MSEVEGKSIFYGNVLGGLHSVNADGTQHFIPEDISPESLKAFATRNGGEPTPKPMK
ncbi:MAG: hypothetical protein ACKVH8_06985 [Pirellulales bacterium]